jgi:hypothetical protein
MTNSIIFQSGRYTTNQFLWFNHHLKMKSSTPRSQAMLEEARKKLPALTFDARVVPGHSVGILGGELPRNRKWLITLVTSMG